VNHIGIADAYVNQIWRLLDYENVEEADSRRANDKVDPPITAPSQVIASTCRLRTEMLS
jgi:hypothetical protein